MTAPEKMETDEAAKAAKAKEEKAGKDAVEKDSSEKKDGEDEEKKFSIDVDDLSEEDKKLKDELDLCVERLKEDDAKLYPSALQSMKTLIRASTTSMTSVPKPLKFMIPHYEAMKEVHEKIADAKVKMDCADVISVLAMTSGNDKNETLEYRLKVKFNFFASRLYLNANLTKF